MSPYFPAIEKNYSWIVPALKWQIFEQVLADFANNAACHTTKNITVPEGIHLLFLPPQSPELQPAERLWTSVNEAIANRIFETIDEMEERVSHRCRVLLKRQEFIRGRRGIIGGLRRQFDYR